MYFTIFSVDVFYAFNICKNYHVYANRMHDHKKIQFQELFVFYQNGSQLFQLV